MFIRALFVVALFISNTAFAQSFDVQIGAFKNASAAQIEVPPNVGELRSTYGADGLTRFLVGPFYSRTEAEQARSRLSAAGFSGAFVRAGDNSSYSSSQSITTQTTQATYTIDSDSGSSVSQRDLRTLQSLSDDERRDLVYLDGVLHRKVGDEFIPLRN